MDWCRRVRYGGPAANENTTIEFSTPVSIEGKPLPAGTYGLHMIPNADTWTVIFSKMAVAWGSYTYNQSEDALRVEREAAPHRNGRSARIRIRRSQTGFSRGDDEMGEGAVPSVSRLLSTTQSYYSIRNQLRGRAQYSWEPLNEAADFCLTHKTNLEDGLKWADLSIQNEERFENLVPKQIYCRQ